MAPEWLINGLSQWTGVPTSVITGLTLQSFEGRMFEQHTSKTNSPWILPLGIFHRTRRLYGMQYCPICLRLDPIPYFRSVWRLAISTVCLEHRVMIRDCCPTCSAPVIFSRIDMTSRTLAPSAPINTCYRCKANLSDDCEISTIGSGLTCSLEIALNAWYRGLDQGWVQIGKITIQYSILAFAVLRQICWLLASNYNGRKLPYQMLAEQIGVRYRPAAERYFENNRIETRHSVLLIAIWLLDDWPERFVRTAVDARLSSAWILRDMRRPAPYWFAKVVDQYLFTPGKPIGATRSGDLLEFQGRSTCRL